MKITEAQKKAYIKYNSSDKKKALDKRYRENNKQSCKDSSARYRAKNKIKIAERESVRNQTTEGKLNIKLHNQKRIKSGKYNEWYNQKYANDLNFRIKSTLRARQHQALSDKKYNRTMANIGCTVAFFKAHIEKQFKEGMSWDNWGTVWQIDHIKPCASFNLTVEKEQKKCFHYLNQQPLWSLDNNLKKDNYKPNEQHEALLNSII